MNRSTTETHPLFLNSPRNSTSQTRLLGHLCLSGSLLLALACDPKAEDPTPAAPPEVSAATPDQPPQPTDPSADPDEDAATSKDDDEGDEDASGTEPVEGERPEPTPPHEGPWLWVTRSSAAVYAEAKKDRKAKIGYVKRGGQVPIVAGTVEGENCSKGWYRVPSGGYICSHVGTTDKNHKDVKFRPRQPNIDEVLPYPYARNSKNGTPLYKTIPTQEQSFQYEPYLEAAKKARKEAEDERAADRKQMEKAGLSLGGASGDDSEEKEVPIWEREENLHEVTLEELAKESDGILASRMMKGFYVAIDKTFEWDGRHWHKTTKGLVTPSSRFWKTEGSDFHGVELDGETLSLPIGWVTGARKSTATYELDTETNKRTPKGKMEKWKAFQLDYVYHRIGKLDYFQMKDGDWIRDAHIRMTTPGERPEEVGPNERWIDVDISEQTLVVFEGDRPVYATLISSGKESRIKEKDHSTPRGMWRVREKHIASTMDGDGSAAGDLPYSIEDVPYIMYFHKSYATHGAFWHRNYGYQMSHGCVNLAPLDAKWIFFFADPQLPEGLHGNWSTESDKGSMVVIHD